MNSTLTLYYSSKILPERNFGVDDIANYLSTLTKTTINDFQYIKHSLFLTIRKDMSQTNLDYLLADNIDYISIQNGTESVVYYFVLNKRWKAQKTIEFDLYMDTINSHQNKYTLSNRTRITREHKDRWVKNESESQTQVISMEVGEYDSDHDYTPATFSVVMTDMTYASSYTYELIPEADIVKDEIYVDNSGAHPVIWGTIFILGDAEGTSQDISITAVRNTYSRVINEYSEGITPQLYKRLEYDMQGDSLKWNLVYRKTGNQEKDPIQELLIPSIPIQIKYAPSDDILSTLYGVLGTTNYGYFSSKFNTSGFFLSITNSDGTHRLEVNNEYIPIFNFTSYQDYSIKFIDSTRFEIYTWEVRYRNGSIIKHINYGKVKINGSTEFTGLSINKSLVNYASLNSNTYATTSTNSLNLTLDSFNILGIDSLNRYDPLLQKVIELPYCPVPYTINAQDQLVFENNVNVSSDSFIILFENEFENEITTEVTNPLEVLREVTLNPSVNDSRDDKNETKLLHSDFYLPKFVYDSFSYPFILEWQENIENDTYLRFKFKPTNTMNSKFLFKFHREHLKLDTHDYSSLLVVSRNNEGIIYNEDYLNYVKNGFNYDKKYKDITQASAIAGGVGSVIGGILSIASNNPALIIGGIGSIATGVMNSVNSIAKSEESLNQKLQEKRLQAIGVEGSDDLNLLDYYTPNNKPKLVYYRVSDRMKNALANLFYFSGYATEEYGVPSLNTRTWFNFIQAEVDFATSYNLSDEILKDIKTRYQVGITFLHKVNNSWNFNQDKENWEVSLFS